MDAEDRARTKSNKQKLLELLQARGVITNEDARRVAGSRAAGRAWELQQELGKDVIQIRKLKGGLWEIRYQQPALARSAETPVAYPDAEVLAFDPWAGDMDDDSVTLRDTFVITRKPATCAICLGKVLVGDRVRSQTQRSQEQRKVMTFRVLRRLLRRDGP